VVRTHLSQGLGFSKADRDTNIRRVGFVAAEIVRHGGVVVCAAVSPYRATRQDVRSMVGADRFVEVFVDTPLDVCEQRDTKGMDAKARRGEIREFTGVDDPYEAPVRPEITLDTLSQAPAANARRIPNYLIHQGLVREAIGQDGNRFEPTPRGRAYGRMMRATAANTFIYTDKSL
jgi:sulfate adenylyltransferase